MIYPVDDSVLVSTRISAQSYSSLRELVVAQNPKSECSILYELLTERLNPSELTDDGGNTHGL